MKRIVALLLAVMMVFAVAAVASALDSPDADKYYKITVDVEGGGSASASTNKIIKNSDGTVTLVASDDGGYFERWIIKGTYEIIEGSLSSPTITIRPTSDISVVAKFSGESKPGEKDSDKTSPKTGDPIVAVIPFMMLALAAAFIASKKLRASK